MKIIKDLIIHKKKRRLRLWQQKNGTKQRTLSRRFTETWEQLILTGAMLNFTWLPKVSSVSKQNPYPETSRDYFFVWYTFNSHSHTGVTQYKKSWICRLRCRMNMSRKFFRKSHSFTDSWFYTHGDVIRRVKRYVLNCSADYIQKKNVMIDVISIWKMFPVW